MHRLSRGARRWWHEGRYLANVAGAFTVVTVVNSVMMLVGWDTPKVGTFAHVHLLSRLGIVAVVVALFHLDDLAAAVRAWRRRGRRARRGVVGTGRHRLRSLGHRPIGAAFGAFTVATSVSCLVAVAWSPWQAPTGGRELYRNLLVLAAVLALLALAASRTIRRRTPPSEPGSTVLG